MDLKETDQKIELIINQPDRMEDEGEIDLVSVFSNMGRKKRIFLPLLAMFLILGLIIPMLIAELSNRNPDAQAVVQLTYEDAQTVSFPSLVLQEALDETVLSQTITISELESNILIEQLLSEETRQKLEVLEQEIEADKSSVGDAGEITLDYENVYIITLSNGFGNPDARKKIYLDATEIQDLLNNIIAAYNNYLYLSKVDILMPDADLSTLSIDDLEYIERLEVIRKNLKTLRSYCQENQNRFPNYRSAANGLSFQDLGAYVALINSVDVNYLYSFVKMRGVAENAATLLDRWAYALRNTQLALDEIESRIESNDAIIREYENESVALSSMDGDFSQSTSVTTEYYNSLVRSQIQLYDRKAELEQSILELEDRIATSSENSSEEMLRYVGAEYAYVYRDALGIQQLVSDYADELLVSDTVENSFMTSTGAQTDSVSFFSGGNLKNAAIGGVVGLVIALALWAVAGFAEEFKKEGTTYGEG